ncbi:hypothetical protein AKJ09_08553 [Labilithrix luteola]|uniref:Uncharacterized protein n=1 Tax=Labilithrix luteola TaxID=1391654 RepID=A0A0K1Q8Z5_9BACT|nr:hypothetical protein [Labilithrix luteola]AKV01890.1 hypothetical protein AKJ09_08553 [Labilithrix luteola]
MSFRRPTLLVCESEFDGEMDAAMKLVKRGVRVCVGGLLFAQILAGCSTPQPSGNGPPPRARSDARPSGAASSSVRAFDAGEGVAVPMTVAPGRYANTVTISVGVTREGTNVESTSAKSSFALMLNVDQTATACRGQRVDSNLDGRRVHNSIRYRERQGYAGTWRQHDDGIEVTLQPDDAVCPPLRRYTDLAPKPWRLRCRSVMRLGSLALGSPALACEVGNAEFQFDEQYAHVLAHILPEGRWLALGSGNGLAIAWNESGVGLHTDQKATVTVSLATTPFDTNAWEK